VTSIAEHPAQASGLDDAPFVVAGHAFRSRLMVGTGKYRTNDEMVAAIEASGAEVVTVAVRRVDLDRTKGGKVYFKDEEDI
jgi:thiazole synthase